MEKKKKLYAILLMAGNSVRFGGNKLLSFVNNKKMYEYTLKLVSDCRQLFDDIIVVTQYEEIKNAAVNANMVTVINDHSERGISSSIQLGLSAIRREKDQAYLFLVGDQPWLKEATIRELIRRWECSGKKIGCVCFDERLGNPVIFSDCYREELMALSGDRGGKKVLYRHLEEVYYYKIAEENELKDIDYQV